MTISSYSSGRRSRNRFNKRPTNAVEGRNDVTFERPSRYRFSSSQNIVPRCSDTQSGTKNSQFAENDSIVNHHKYCWEPEQDQCAEQSIDEENANSERIRVGDEINSSFPSSENSTEDSDDTNHEQLISVSEDSIPLLPTWSSIWGALLITGAHHLSRPQYDIVRARLN